MSFPNFGPKFDKVSLFSPRDFVRYALEQGKIDEKNQIPELMFLCYHGPLMQKIEKDERFERREKFFVHKEKGWGIIGNFGIGAPVAAVVMEEFIARGVKRFISFGYCGTLQKNLKIGDYILIEKAIRDEGTSHHYLPSEKYAHASQELVNFLEDFLKKEKIKFVKGSTWTTDAIYRETVDEVKAYQEEGVLGVDMEAAALFAVAKYRQVDCAGLFIVSDCLADGKNWKPHFHTAKDSLYKLFDKLHLAF